MEVNTNTRRNLLSGAAMIKWHKHFWDGIVNDLSLIEYFENDNADEQYDVEYPKHTLQCIALALVRISNTLELALQSNRE